MNLAHDFDCDDTVIGRPGHEPGDAGTSEWHAYQRKVMADMNVETRRAMNAYPRAWPGELERGIPPGWFAR